jgi:hypothetical protein
LYDSTKHNIAQALRALRIEGVPWTKGNNLALDTATNERHITYQIQ